MSLSVAQKRLTLLAYVALVLTAWWWLARGVPSYLFPGPAETFSVAIDFLSTPRKLLHLSVSMVHIVEAIVFAFVFGMSAALLAWYVPVFDQAIHQRISPFFNSFSSVGWTFLAIMWFGVSSTAVVFSIAVVLLPFAIINIREGLASLDAEMMEMGHSFSDRKLRLFLAIILPSLFPFMFATLRIMFGVAWKVALTSELFGGGNGLGYLLNNARQDYDTPTIFVIILIILFLVYGLDRGLLAPVERVLFRQRQAGAAP